MSTFKLEQEMNIANAADQKARLLELLASCDELDIDLGQVTEIDTAGLQLLVLVKREAAKAGKTLNFVMHSPAVLAILELTRMTRVFGDQIVLSEKAR